MTSICITIIATWILFSALLVTVICMNSSRLNKVDEPFKDPFDIKKMMEEEDE